MTSENTTELAQHHRPTSKSILKPSSSFEVDIGGNDNNADTKTKPTELHLRWARLRKQVEIKDEAESTLTKRISKVAPIARRSSMMAPKKVILNDVR